MEIISKIKDKLQSRKFWLVVFVFAGLLVFLSIWMFLGIALTVAKLFKDNIVVEFIKSVSSMFIKLCVIGGAIIGVYAIANVGQKAMNGEGIFGKLLNKVRGKND